MFTFLYSSASKLRFKWGQDTEYTGKMTGNDALSGGIYFGYLTKKLARSEVASPTKRVSDTDETNVTDNTIEEVAEVFTYSVYHNVPDEWEEYYYNSYVFTDSICDVLDIQS